MATLGDPLADLGLLGLYWHIRPIEGGGSAAPSAVRPAAGYPVVRRARRRLRAPAAAAASRTSAGTVAFAAYKLAVILEGIHYRYLQGETVGDGFDRIGAARRRRSPTQGLAQLAEAAS